MFSSNTETNITATYQDSDGTIDLVAAAGGSAADDISTGDAAVTIGTSSGDITLDSPADIILDADGADVLFKDGGTQFGRIGKGGASDLIINASIADKDIIFSGTDGSTAIDALVLDMSANGQLLGIANTTTNPTYSFAGDTNTGVTRPTGDTLTIVTGGTERHRTGSTGKASWSANGIGDVTTVPRDFAFYTEGATNGLEVRSNDERLVFMGAGGSSGAAVDSGYLAIANGGTTKIALNANGTSDIGGGPVNMSLQPAFDAGRNAGYVTDDQNFIQDYARTNIGSHYNTSNGRFTAPVDGQYLVMFRIFTHDSGGVVQAEVTLKKNSGSALIARAHKVGAYHTPVQMTKVLTLAANDYIYTYVGDSGTSSGWQGSAHEYNYFCAFLIG
jgi:hypothetical protein